MYKTKIINITKQLLLKSFEAFFIGIIFILLLLQTPYIQDQSARMIVANINKYYHIDISVDKVHLKFNGNAGIDDVLIRDHQKDTLLYVRNTELNLQNVINVFKGDIAFNNIAFDHTVLKIGQYPQDSIPNWKIFLNKIASDSSNKISQEIDEIHLENTKISFINSPLLEQNQMNIKNLSAQDINIHEDIITVKLIIEDISTGSLDVEHLAADIDMHKENLKISHIDLQTPNSRIKANISSVIKSNTIKEFKISTQSSHIDLIDFKSFFPSIAKSFPIDFQIKARADNQKITLEKIAFKTGNSILQTKGDFSQYKGNKKKYDISLSNIKGDFSSADYNRLVEAFPSLLTVLPFKTNLSINANIKLYDESLQLILKGDSDQYRGYIDLLANQVFDLDSINYVSTARLDLNNLDLITGIKKLKKATIEGQLEGKGLNKEQWNFNLFSILSNLEYANHTYQNMPLTIKMSNQQTSLNIISNQDYLDGSIDIKSILNQEQKSLQLTANINKMKLFKILDTNSPKESFIKGLLDLNLKGLNADYFWGILSLKGLEHHKENSIYRFDDIESSFNLSDTLKYIDIQSTDMVNGQLYGNISIKNIKEIITNTKSPFKLENSKQFSNSSDNGVNFDFTIYNKFFESFIPKISIADKSVFRGNYYSENSNTKIFIQSDSIRLDNISMHDVNLEFDNSNYNDNNLKISKLKTKLYQWEDISITNQLVQDTLNINIQSNGGDNNIDTYYINTYLTSNENAIALGLKKSYVDFKKRTWTINPLNETSQIITNHSKDSIGFRNIKIKNNEQSIKINGWYSDENKRILVDILNINIDDIIPNSSNMALSGLLNVEGVFLQKKDINFAFLDLSINNMTMYNHDVGDLSIRMNNNKSLIDYATKISIDNNGQNQLESLGNININTQDQDVSLYLINKLDKFNVAFLNIPNPSVSNIRGLLTGEVSIAGSVKDFFLDGIVQLKDASISIPYVNVDMAIQDGTMVRLNNKSAIMKDIDLTDTTYGTHNQISGQIDYQPSDNSWYFDLHLDTQDKPSLIVNTTENTQEENIYYGSCFADANVDLVGSIGSLSLAISGDITQKTDMTFLMDNKDIQEINDDFIIINNPKSLEQNKEKEESALIGFFIDLNLNIKPKSILRSKVINNDNFLLTTQGSGNLSIQMGGISDDVKVSGKYIIDKGDYDVKYLGLVNKKFKILPKGSIQWNGDVTKGVLNDIESKYSLKANPDKLTGISKFNSNIDTDVIVKINGTLDAIQTEFFIDFPTLDPYLKEDIDFYLRNPKEREIQALSLIVRRSFKNTSNNNTTISDNISESTSQLISGVFNDVDDPVNINFSYQKNQYISNTPSNDNLGINLSTDISDRIKFNGKIGVPVNNANNISQSNNNIAGEGELEFLLNKEKTLSLRVFNKRSDYGNVSFNQQNNYKKGVGMSYNLSFNTFKEFTTKLFKKKKDTISTPSN